MAFVVGSECFRRRVENAFSYYKLLVSHQDFFVVVFYLSITLRSFLSGSKLCVVGAAVGSPAGLVVPVGTIVL